MSADSEISTTKNVVMVILAAGGSTRMPGAKQLLPWKNTTLIGNAINTGLLSKVTKVVVVLGAYAERIRSTINHLDIEIVENKDWEKGLSSSITAAIKFIEEKNIHADGLLISLADMPFIDADYFNNMIANFATKDDSIIAAKLHSKATVPALFDSVYFPELGGLSGDIGAKNILKKYKDKLTLMDVVSNEQMIDLDTWEDYQQHTKS